jgi:hypothetical protein
MKKVLVFLLVLQAVALAGPVCGNHLTVSESMDCCEKGHNHDGSGMRDDHATSCCSSCDTGKTQLLKKQEPIQPVLTPAIELITIQTFGHLPYEIDAFQHSISPSPPDIFLFDRSLRI